MLLFVVVVKLLIDKLELGLVETLPQAANVGCIDFQNTSRQLRFDKR